MKSKRHELILNIIASADIETQEELAAALEQHGVKVTQATVSRDIKSLGLIKVPGNSGVYKYAVAAPVQEEVEKLDRHMRIFRDTVLSLNDAGNLIVLKTISASAQTAAEAIDNLSWPEIIGTIAGDNTVLVIVKNIEDVADVMNRFEKLTGKQY
ncbi:MAG: arginine repressor [Clostridia bacterium]|nr:arginine repressor [Clostridia bacterium]